MAWPPITLPVNFGNATVSLNTHPQSHNATNAVINSDIVPEINAIRANIPDPIGQFTPTLTYKGASIPLDNVVTRWVNAYGIVHAWANFTVAAGSSEAGEIRFGFSIDLPPLPDANLQPLGAANYTQPATPGTTPPGQLARSNPREFLVIISANSYLTLPALIAGTRFRWSATWIA